jgi:cephalosporin-C deacetylase-like acetyl esterase
MPGWLAGGVLAFVSVRETLLTWFTLEMRCARALVRGMGGDRKASAMTAIAARNPQIATLFLMAASTSWFYRMVVTCLSRCQSGLSGLT